MSTSECDIKILDMHAHPASFEENELRGELQLRHEHNIKTCFSCMTPGEWKELEPFRKRESLLLSFGIHPWQADKYKPEEYLQYYKDCDYIGEIGMDSVWCDIPLAVQRDILIRQMDIAGDLKKPVLLHTKGQEREIFEVIKDYPYPSCVHWYSGTVKDLDLYIEKGCYFTLGPDFSMDLPLYRYLLSKVPLTRLFLETDGIAAVAWLRHKSALSLEEIHHVLEKNMKLLAAYYGIGVNGLSEQLNQNLRDFS